MYFKNYTVETVVSKNDLAFNLRDCKLCEGADIIIDLIIFVFSVISKCFTFHRLFKLFFNK